MNNRNERRQRAFDRHDFEAHLRMIMPDYRDRLRSLFAALSGLDYLMEHPEFLNLTGPIVVSGNAAELRGDPETRIDHMMLSIPFTDVNTGICLEFGLARKNREFDTWVHVNIRKQAGLTPETLLDLWEYCHQNSYSSGYSESLILASGDFETELNRVLEKASQLLRDHCENFVRGESWPYTMSELVDMSSPDEFRATVESLGNLHTVDRRGRTLLTHAVVAGRVDLVRVLLDMGANPNFVSPQAALKPAFDTCGFAALHFLAGATELDPETTHECFTLLHSHGAEVDLQTANHYTPLGLASRHLNIDVLRSLLKTGAKQLGQGWDWWATGPGEAPINARIVDQMLRSALGQPSRLKPFVPPGFAPPGR